MSEVQGQIEECRDLQSQLITGNHPNSQTNINAGSYPNNSYTNINTGNYPDNNYTVSSRLRCNTKELMRSR